MYEMSWNIVCAVVTCSHTMLTSYGPLCRRNGMDLILSTYGGFMILFPGACRLSRMLMDCIHVIRLRLDLS